MAEEPAIRGGWYGLLDIVREARQLHEEEQYRDPEACLDCGEPLRTGPNGERYCRSDGSIWQGNQRVGRVGSTYI